MQVVASLTVKSLAEMLDLPVYQQSRILYEQKYPNKEPQLFRTPYYSPSLTVIREFYRSTNKAGILSAGLAKMDSLSLAARRTNNKRILESFATSSQTTRILEPIVNSRVARVVHGVELRLGADMRAMEGAKEKLLYYNCRGALLDPKVARLTCEIAHWVLEGSGLDLPLGNIEYFDLAAGKLYRSTSRRATTISRLKLNAKIIATLWPTI